MLNAVVTYKRDMATWSYPFFGDSKCVEMINKMGGERLSSIHIRQLNSEGARVSS